MSRQRVTEHLNDMMYLAQWLLESLSSHDQKVTKSLLKMFLSKQQHVQDLVRQLVQRQLFEQRASTLRSKIAEVDGKISSFVSELGVMEANLHQAYTKGEATDDNASKPSRKQFFNVHEVLVFAERLGLMSVAPADYVEPNGMSLCRPPAPLEDMMGASRLHRSIDELLEDSAGPEDVELTKAQQEATPGTKALSAADAFEVPDDWDEDGSDFEVEDIAALWSRQRLQQQQQRKTSA